MSPAGKARSSWRMVRLAILRLVTVLSARSSAVRLPFLTSMPVSVASRTSALSDAVVEDVVAGDRLQRDLVAGERARLHVLRVQRARSEVDAGQRAVGDVRPGDGVASAASAVVDAVGETLRHSGQIVPVHAIRSLVGGRPVRRRERARHRRRRSGDVEVGRILAVEPVRLHGERHGGNEEPRRERLAVHADLHVPHRRGERRLGKDGGAAEQAVRPRRRAAPLRRGPRSRSASRRRARRRCETRGSPDR